MRPIEILIVALVLLTVPAIFLAGSWRKPVLSLVAMSLLAIALLAHIVIEGPHWQMAPAYAAALLLPVYAAVQRQPWRGSLAAAIVLLTIAGCGFSAFLPMFRLPPPAGPYAIGTQIVPLVNDHPRDPSSAGPDGKRALMIQIWYPAMPSHEPRAPYRIWKETTPVSSYQAVLWTHGRWNAPLASGTGAMPVLLLNPAWNGRRTYYMYLVEELASQGYVVVGIDHTGNSGPIAFPDGHVSTPPQDGNLDFQHRTYAQLNAYGAQQQEIQVEDDRFVLDQLELLDKDPSSRYFQRLDMGRVGALGHSFGGSVSAQDCLEDPRFKAALDMDGSYWGKVQNAGLAKPLMMIEEDLSTYTPEQLQRDLGTTNDHLFDLSDDATLHNSNGYRVLLHGSTHSSFTDRSLFSPSHRYSGEGGVPALREYTIIRSYVLAFFNKTLNGIDSPLLNPINHTFPETTLEVLHRPQN
jgi:predicted dienelactone hydrolase